MAKLIDGTLYLTVDSVAEALATTEMRVLMLMRAQELVGLEKDGEWLLEADSVTGFLSKPPGPEIVAGCSSACASVKGCACKG